MYDTQMRLQNREFGPVTLASAVGNAGGAQTAFSFPVNVTNIGWTTAYTGSPTGASVTLEGSLDGTNFYTIDTSTSTSGEYRAVSDKPVRAIRANVGTLSGGSTPKVTITAAGNV